VAKSVDAGHPDYEDESLGYQGDIPAGGTGVGVEFDALVTSKAPFVVTEVELRDSNLPGQNNEGKKFAVFHGRFLANVAGIALKGDDEREEDFEFGDEFSFSSGGGRVVGIARSLTGDFSKAVGHIVYRAAKGPKGKFAIRPSLLERAAKEEENALLAKLAEHDAASE